MAKPRAGKKRFRVCDRPCVRPGSGVGIVAVLGIAASDRVDPAMSPAVVHQDAAAPSDPHEVTGGGDGRMGGCGMGRPASSRYHVLSFPYPSCPRRRISRCPPRRLRMCGIAGWYRRAARPVWKEDVGRQCDAIRHRGPDGAGVMVDRDFGFGMRRLSIVDIPGGDQPISSPDGRYAIVYNGEVYNHPELRSELEGRGHAFRTRSDTETVLAAFVEWGDGAWRRLEGMFAAAVWDRAERRLTLARDHLGIKPLYVSEQSGGLSFASELKALTVLPLHAFDVDERAVHDFFAFGHVRRPRSIYRQVRALEPGTSMSLGPAGETTSVAFWRPRPRSAPARSLDEWTEEMRSLLLGTTARHMQSDVPVGAFLSGGIDSATVLAAARRSTGATMKAFTIGHPGASIDETEAAGEIAAHLGCEHIVLPLDAQDAQEDLPEILGAYDEPFADLAAIPTWYASRLAAEHVKVVLCGEGGDELFAGYKRHRNARAIERARPAIGVLRPLAAALGRLPTGGSRAMAGVRHHAERASEFMSLSDGYQQFFAATQTSSMKVRRQVLGAGFLGDHAPEGDFAALEREYFPDDAGDSSALGRFLLADLSLNMPSAMLTRLDRGSMAHSLEARVPFLSHKVVEWALALPDDLKLRGMTGKYLLRRAVAPWLPASVARRPKQGFQVPHAQWLRGGFGRHAEAVWEDSGASGAGYLDPGAVRTLFAEHRRGERDHARLLYSILVFAIWWRKARR
jgi:asparagine synthase (glutamine-hydrolysing)